MGWIILLLIIYFTSIKLIYLSNLILILNFFRGLHSIKKERIFFEDEILLFTDEDGMWYYRTKINCFLKAFQMSFKFWFLELINPFVILSFIYSFLLSMSYFKITTFVYETSILKVAFFLFVISEFSYLFGKVYGCISIVLKK